MKSKQIKSNQGKNHRFFIGDQKDISKRQQNTDSTTPGCHVVGSEQHQETAMEQEQAVKESNEISV